MASRERPSQRTRARRERPARRVKAASWAVPRASPSSSRAVARSSWASAASSSSSAASRSSSASTASRSSGVSGPQSTLCLPSRAAASTRRSPVALAVATARSAMRGHGRRPRRVGGRRPGERLGQRRLDLGGQGRVGRGPGQRGLQQPGHLGGVGARLHPDGVQAQGGPGQDGPPSGSSRPGQVGGLPERLAGAGGVAGAAQRLAQAGQQPGPALRVELPGRLGQPQRPPVVPGRVLVGQDGGGLLGGQLAVADGPGRVRRGELPALVDGPQVVAGQLGRAHLRPAAAAASRVAAASRWSRARAAGSSWPYRTSRNRSWANRQGPSSPAGPTSTLAPAAWPSRASTVADGLAGDRGQDGRAQVGTEHRGRLEQPDAGVAEGGEPALDRVAHPVRDPTEARPGGRPAAGRPAGRGTGCRRSAGARSSPSSGSGSPPVTPASTWATWGASRPPSGRVRPSASSRAIGPAERVAGRDLDVAVGRDQQLGAAAGPAGVEGGQLDRRRVGPVQVVEHDHQRRRGPAASSRAPLTAWKRSNRARATTGRLAGRAGVLEAGLDPERGQGLQPGPERRGALPAGAPDDGRAPLLGVVGGGRGQGGLADPGLAGEGDDPAPGGQRGLDQRRSSASGWSRPTRRRRGRGHGTRTVRSPDPLGRKGVSRR